MIKRLLDLYQNNLRIKQVVSLLAVNVFIIPLSFVSNIIITRFLGPIAFGDFKFLLYVFSFSLVLFNFGFFQAGNRALVLNTDLEKAREYYGSMLVILLGLFLVMQLYYLVTLWLIKILRPKDCALCYLHYSFFLGIFIRLLF